MIAVPGHTRGMMCALIPEERTVFFGDACGNNVLLKDQYATSVSEYLKSLKKLRDMEHRWDTIYRNHGDFTSSKDMLDNVIDCCEKIINHADEHHPVQVYGITLYEAVTRINGLRRDGKHGNVIYAEEKRK